MIRLLTPQQNAHVQLLKKKHLDYIRNRTDIDEAEKQALIDQAYASVGNNEGVLPDYIIENKLKVISWDDNISPEETAREVELYFDFAKKTEV